jgi:putative hydrolase of the HAD superfamily
MTGFEAVLFDAGGTLIHVDGERVCAAARAPYSPDRFYAAETAATSAAGEWIRRHPESTDAERMPVFLGELLRSLGLPEEDREDAAIRIAREHRRANLWSAATPGARETLAALKGRGYRLGVISNADGRVRQLLEEAELAPHLEIIVDSSVVGVEKPDPRIFLSAVGLLGLEASRCAYVGDLYETDIAGARAAGLRPILIGACPAPEPVERIAGLAELLELFPGLGGFDDRL